MKAEGSRIFHNIGSSGRNRRESVHRVPVTDSIISSSEIMITINLKISF